MPHLTDSAIMAPGLFERAEGNFAAHREAIYRDTDRMFGFLMAVQWIAGIAAAMWISPRTWIGSTSQTSTNVWAAVFLGGAICLFPIVLAVKSPGKATTRYVIATAQMLMSALLIHLTGGRIETHFHVFGSLAFLAFYRDRNVLIPATVVVALDHILRGVFWPQSVYGVLFASNWRWLEHAGWVLFEDAVLFVAIRRSVTEMWDMAVRSAQATDLNEGLEHRVAARTAEIVSINKGLQRLIADRGLAEKALRQSEERYRLLFENNPHPMWVYDDETLAFLAVNQAAIDRYGYSREEFLLMNANDIHPAEAVPALNELPADEVTGPGISGVWRHRTKNGAALDVEITSHSLDFAGRPAKLVLANDITKRRRMEEERQAMFEIIQGISATPNLDELLKLIHASISKLVYAENCFVALHEPATDLMHFPFWMDHHDPRPAPRPIGAGFSSYVLRTGQPILLDRELTKDFVSRGEVQKSGTSSASWLGVPLRTPSRTIGVLVLQHYEDESAYSQADLEFLMSVGGQIAVAIERRRNEEALQISESEHRSIFDNATMGIYRSSSDGRVIKANDAFVKMLGYDSVAEVLQCNLQNDVYFYPEQRASLLAQRRPIGVAHELEVLWKKRDGTPIWVHLNAKAVEDSDHSVCFDTCVHDITQRVQAEEALRHSERRFAQAFNASPQPMSITTLNEGRYVDVNDSFLNVSGCTRDEVIGHTTSELGIWRSESDRRAMIDLLDATGSVRNLETQVFNKQGETRVLLSSVEKVDIDGDECLLISSSDITERKLAEESLREANERALKDYEQLVERIAALGQTLGNARELNTIFRALRDFAMVSVPCDGLVISLYDAEREVRRVTYCWTDHKEFDPKDLSEIPVGNGMTGKAIKSGSVIIDNNYHRQLKGAKITVSFGAVDQDVPRSALAAPMTFMGRTVGCVEVQTHRAGTYQQEHATAMRMAANLAATAVENVSLIEREQAKEEQLRQSQKMEAVGQLAGGIAHDFNNLLTAITGYSELALREVDSKSSLHGKVTEIKKAGDRAASLTRQLLAFSRKQILQAKVLDLNAVIPEMEKMLRRLIGENIVLETVLEPSLGQVKADPGQIEQIVMNLCVNARDAMPDGGRLTIETSNVSLKQSYRNEQFLIRAGNYVMLSVSDNGCGMDAETQARIFEPFFTTKELGKGTGLGLSTVYGIVKQSEGTIWVYSEAGKGTTFKIYLPRVDEASDVANQPAESLLPPTGDETILVVEDEDVVRALSTEVLEQHGYQVLSATNGAEALRLCREFSGRIDLLITDVVMPRMSGRELAEQFAIIRPETRVLYMSGFTDDAIVRHGVLDDDLSFIQKPFSPDALAFKTRSVLDNGSRLIDKKALSLEKQLADITQANHGHITSN